MSHCAPSEMNTSDSLIPMSWYTFSAMTLRRFCTCMFAKQSRFRLTTVLEEFSVDVSAGSAAHYHLTLLRSITLVSFWSG